MIDDFLGYNNWFDMAYKAKLDSRWPTFKVALNLLGQLPTHRIVETGCLRMVDDWGGGQSTLIFGDFAYHYNGTVITVDVSKANMEVCKKVTEPFKDNISYMVDDSIKALMSLVSTGYLTDLLYLDSVDCDPADMAVNKFPQEHQLNELLIGLSLLHDRSIILLDDAGFVNGGKVELSRRYLRKIGWTELLCNQQSLWVRR
ncbi:MAG: hypothetical protein WC822_04495 [Candidatus Paceibacterota bacterium]|jgi:hypothetical protein